MDLWHAEVFWRGDMKDHDDFHGRQAAQDWAEDKLREFDLQVVIEWRRHNDIWEAGPSPDFCARVYPKA